MTRQDFPNVLVADTKPGLDLLAWTLNGVGDLTAVESFEDAEAAYNTSRPDVVVVGYHFDALRPYRLIQSIRESEEQETGVPILLVRGLNLELPLNPAAEIRESYKAMGVDEFVCLFGATAELGTDGAYAHLQQTVLRLARERRQNTSPRSSRRA